MDLVAVRDAYTTWAGEYAALTAGCALEHEGDVALVREHLAGLDGPVLDLGCGPGHWTDLLRRWGADASGIDLVPAFVVHARQTYPGTRFELGSMTGLDLPDGSVADVLAWYSTIHVPPDDLGPVLAELHRLLRPAGVLVLGFFDSSDEVGAFDHRVATAYRWPVDTLAGRLVAAGFTELQRRTHQRPERSDRLYAALVVRSDAR